MGLYVLRMKGGGVKDKGELWESLKRRLQGYTELMTAVALIGQTITLDYGSANLLHG